MKKLFFKSILLLSIVTTSCGSDDDSNNTNSKDCSTQPKAEIATGSFKGQSFTVTGGRYTDQSFGDEKRYSCAIYIKPVKSGSCFFPNFEGLNEQILFSINSLEPQTIVVSDVFSGEIKPTLNFNRIANTNDGPETQIELSCGTLIISGVENNQLKGRVFANGTEGSTVNGAFTLDLCDLGF